MPMLLPLGFLIDLEYMPGWKAALIFAALGTPIVWLGMRSLVGLGSVRKWVAIAIRLLVLPLDCCRLEYYPSSTPKR